MMDCGLTSPEEVGFSRQHLAHISPAMQAYVDQRGYAGITTLLARRGRVVHFDQVGRQDREGGTVLSPDTIFRIYSMTKPIVCTAFMTLVAEGAVRLSDPVAKFLPAFGNMRVLTETRTSKFRYVAPIRPITACDLLTHTAGLTYDFLENSPVSELYRQARLMADAGRSLEALIDELASLPLAYQPGTQWQYSFAIDVIGRLIEVVSGQPLEEFLRRRLFGPLRMTDTGFSVPPEKTGRIATMYGYPDVAVNSMSRIVEAWKTRLDERRDVAATYPADNTRSFVRGGHGLFSTALDYLRFAQMLLNRGELDGIRILAPEIVDLMHRNHLSPDLMPYSMGGISFQGYGFGLGSRVLLDPARSKTPAAVGEFGWDGAAKTFYWIDPKNQLIGIFMAQFMAGPDLPERDFQRLSYQALGI